MSAEEKDESFHGSKDEDEMDVDMVDAVEDDEEGEDEKEGEESA